MFYKCLECGNIFESGETELEVDIDVLQEVYEEFVHLMAIEKLIARRCRKVAEGEGK